MKDGPQFLPSVTTEAALLLAYGITVIATSRLIVVYMDANDLPPVAIRENIGRRISLLREARGLSPHAFSQMLGMDRSYLIDIERGRRNVSFNYLARIAMGLHISLSELFEGVDTPHA